MAKLQESFYVTDPRNNLAQVKWATQTDQYKDFIDFDEDRFLVWVYDPVKWNDVDAAGAPVNLRIQAGIESIGVDDLTYVSLVRSTEAPSTSGAVPGQGWFVSDSQVLTSNKIDDTYNMARVLQIDDKNPSGLGYPKNAGQFDVSDRTHKAKLGSVIVAKYKVAGDAHKASKNYDVPVKHYVKLVITSLSVGNKVYAIDKVSKQMVEKANEQFAQVGIKLVAKYNTPLGNIPGVNLTNFGFDVPFLNLDGSKVIGYTTETSALLDNMNYRTAETDDIEIFVVNNLYRRQKYVDTGIKKYINGIAINADGALKLLDKIPCYYQNFRLNFRLHGRMRSGMCL